LAASAIGTVSVGRTLKARVIRETASSTEIIAPSSFALAAEHRAESFYSDTAMHARDAMVRSCAGELAQIKSHRLRQLERLIARRKRIDWFGPRSQESGVSRH